MRSTTALWFCSGSFKKVTGSSKVRTVVIGLYLFSLEPAPPFQLELTVSMLRQRPDNEGDRWDGGTYPRALPLSGKFVEVGVTGSALGQAEFDRPRLSPPFVLWNTHRRPTRIDDVRIASIWIEEQDPEAERRTTYSFARLDAVHILCFIDNLNRPIVNQPPAWENQLLQV